MRVDSATDEREALHMLNRRACEIVVVPKGDDRCMVYFESDNLGLRMRLISWDARGARRGKQFYAPQPPSIVRNYLETWEPPS